MKLLTITVPCYNSSSYMRKCLDSCIIGGEAVEVIVVNDGSQDDTADIAEAYVREYPNIVRVINQTNKGHGGAVNAGIQAATGLYFKVVDSDDWLEEAALLAVLEQIKQFIESDSLVDMLVSDFVYEQENVLIQKKMKYRSNIPIGEMIGWEQISEFKQRQYLLMHSLIFKTDILLKSQLALPEHTFYVDNLFVFVPLQNVEKIYYLDVPLYRYFIGRDDQSINENIMIQRIDQQLKVNKLMIDVYRDRKNLPTKLDEYLLKHLQVVTLISSALLNKMGTDESVVLKNDLWNYLEEQTPEAYLKIRGTLSAKIVNLRGNRGRRISNTLYKTVRKAAGYS